MPDHRRLESLERWFDPLKPFQRPPVDTWNPDQIIDFDLEIRANGHWVHEGTIIKRRELIKLFSTVLVRRAGTFLLLTPRVGYRIRVEDTPFQALELSISGEQNDRCIWFRTDMDEVVSLDGAHPLDPRVNPETGEPSPTIVVREGLEARLQRTVYYQLADLVEAECLGSERYGVRSCGGFFPLM